MPLRMTPRSKYHAQPVVIDGIRFASKKEGARYVELKLLERAGEIRDLELQPKFPLFAADPRGQMIRVAEYRGDFRYWTCVNGGRGVCVVEDAKGCRTAVYVLKKKLCEANYGIRITEV